jgi:hypothetical protein
MALGRAARPGKLSRASGTDADSDSRAGHPSHLSPGSGSAGSAAPGPSSCAACAAAPPACAAPPPRAPLPLRRRGNRSVDTAVVTPPVQVAGPMRAPRLRPAGVRPAQSPHWSHWTRHLPAGAPVRSLQGKFKLPRLRDPGPSESSSSRRFPRFSPGSEGAYTRISRPAVIRVAAARRMGSHPAPSPSAVPVPRQSTPGY